jgi:hypothetical protein
MLSTHCESDSTPGGELRGDVRLARSTCFHKIVQNAVGDRFVEGTRVSIRSQIKLEGLAFDAELIRHIIDVDPGKIGLTRDRTNGSEIIRFKMNPVVSARRIWESFEPRLRRRRGQFRLASSQQCESTCNFSFCHCNIKAVNRFASIGIASGHGRHMEGTGPRLIFIGSHSTSSGQAESRPTRKQLS